MTIEEMIPDNDPKWKINKTGDALIYQKLDKVSLVLLYLRDGVYHIVLENRLKRPTIKLIKHLRNKNIKFYLMPPESYFEEVTKTRIIDHYLYSYIQPQFNSVFKKIDFDIIQNLDEWIKDNDCLDLFNDSYEYILKEVNRMQYYSWDKDIDVYPEQIKEEFIYIQRDFFIKNIMKEYGNDY